MQQQQKKYSTKQLSKQYYEACMILSGVGDAMGYKNGDWQFNTSGQIIHSQMMKMTQNKGVQYLKINMSWRYSDDTVMHIATAKALIKQKHNLKDINKMGQQLAVEYVISGTKMSGRAPGKSCMKSIQILNKNGDNWNKIPYNDRGGGCGGAMRSACIGLVYPLQQNIKQLIKVSIQSGRITHHNPIGYLGSMVAAYFTTLGLRKVEVKYWVAYLLQEGFANRQVEFNLKRQSWTKFVQGWQKYAKIRNLPIKIKQENKQPLFPENYGVKQRDNFYTTIATGKWPGATGLDSTMIAYDALLGCKGSWKQFCLRGILHGGDNDSTGAIGGAWFGACYGFKTVPQRHYKQLQDNVKLRQLGNELYKIRLKQ